MPAVDFRQERGRSSAARSLAEHALVRLRVDVVEQGKRYAAGSTGTVVHVHRGGGYIVELTRPTHGVVTVEAGDINAID